MANRPQHSDSINLIKYSFCINKLKSPIWFSRISVQNILNPMYQPTNSRLQYHTKLVILTCVGSPRSHDLQHTLRNKSGPGFPDAYRTYYGLLIQLNESARHKCNNPLYLNITLMFDKNWVIFSFF